MSLKLRFCTLSLALAINGLDAQVVLSPTRYDVRFEVDYDAELLRGTARVVVQNAATSATREASFLLYRLLRVQSVRDEQGKELAFRQSVVTFSDFTQLQVNQILVTLPEPLAGGARTTVELRYEGHLLGYAETGMRYIQDRIDSAFTILRPDSYAYPAPGYPSFAAIRSAPQPEFSWSARITVPTGFTVANGGRLEGADTLGKTVTFRYASLKPSWRMDFAIAKYTTISTGAIRVFHLAGDSLGAAGVAQAARTSLDLYTRWFGPLRATTGLTFIEIPNGWGSQSDVTTIIQSAAAFKDPERHREVYHEISHLWNVPPTDRPSPRWNEGQATFLEYLVAQEVTGKPLVDERANELVEWLRGALPTRERWRSVPLVDYGKAGLTDLSYSVGALYFNLLYRLAGRDAFNRIIGEFASEFGARGGSTRDFADVVRKTSSVDLSELNNDWIFTAGWTDRVAQSASIQEIEAYYRRALRAPAPAGAPPPEKTISSATCHIRFRHPADWVVAPDRANRARCSFVLRPVDWPARVLKADSVDLFTTNLAVHAGGVWAVARSTGFERRNGAWVVLGRQGAASPADSVTGKGWAGVRGLRSVGCFRLGGNQAYSGLCDAPSAVVGTATRSVTVEGGPQAEDLVDRILATLEFLP